jgi:hypothetical protein
MDAEERSGRSRDHPGRHPQLLPSVQTMRSNPSDLSHPDGSVRRTSRRPGLARISPGRGFVRHPRPRAWIGPLARVTPLLRWFSPTWLCSARSTHGRNWVRSAQRAESPGRWVRSADPLRIGRVACAGSPAPTGGWVRSDGVRAIGFARRNRRIPRAWSSRVRRFGAIELSAVGFGRSLPLVGFARQEWRPCLADAALSSCQRAGPCVRP